MGDPNNTYLGGTNPDLDDPDIVSLNAVYAAESYSGANLGAKIQAAHNAMPSTGGTIDASTLGLRGNQTLGAITITKPTRIILGYQTITTTGSITLQGVQANLEIEGRGQKATTITTPNNAPWITFSGNFSDNKNYIKIHGIKFLAGTGNSQILLDDSALTDGSTRKFNESQFFFYENHVANYRTTYAIRVGANFYFNVLERNYFYNNLYLFESGQFADTAILNNKGISSGQIHSYGSDLLLHGNIFTPGTQTTPDLWIDALSNGGDGFIWVDDNRFGPEGDIIARKKVRIESSTNAAYVIPDVLFTGNKFFSGDDAFGQTAVDLLSPVRHLKFTGGNHFDGFAYAVNDSQPLGHNGEMSNGGIWLGNTVTNKTMQAFAGSVSRVFTNGGRGFDIINDMSLALQDRVIGIPAREPTALVNRLSYSEDLNNAAWTKSAGVTSTGGQTDPFGGTTAHLVFRPGTVAGESIRAAFSTAAIGSAPAMGNKVFMTFWAKSGSSSILTAGVRDTTSAAWNNLTTLAISSTWKQYELPAVGLDNTHTFQAFFFPGGASTPLGTAADVYISRVQISDQPTTYYPTSGAAATGSPLVYSNVNAPVGVEFTVVTTGISMTTPINTDTTLFTVPAGRKFMLTYASAVTTTVTGFVGTTAPQWTIRESLGSGIMTNSPIGNASWGAVDMVTHAGLSATAGNKVASGGANIQFRNINQNTSTAFVVRSEIRGKYIE